MGLLDRFWVWYEKHFFVNLTIAASLFVLQLIHLFWLTTDVVFFRLFGISFFPQNDFLRTLIAVVDYTEIPALITTSFVYLNFLRKSFQWKNIIFLLFLNSQWIHLFWITDEVVVEAFTQKTLIGFPIWLAWIAILIDYLELPVIADTVRRVFSLLAKKDLQGMAKAIRKG